MARSPLSTRPRPGTTGRRRAAGVARVAGIAALLGCGPGADPGAAEGGAARGDSAAVSAPAAEATSALGRYRIAVRPAAPPAPLHRLHDWIVRIELRDGVPEIPRAVHFDGGMPSHGHGFVTRPRVTENLGGGEFRVEGVKFHMPGTWVLRVTVTSASGSDRAELPVEIAP